jgi:hypothetical protein
MTLNVNGLISLNKRCRSAEWLKKIDSTISCLQGTHFTGKDEETESDRTENDIPIKWKSKSK